MVGFVPPDLWAAVEVEPDEQRLDLEGVELGLRAPGMKNTAARKPEAKNGGMHVLQEDARNTSSEET